MPASFGNRIRVTLFGQSHSAAMGAVIDGLPAGFPIDTQGLAAFMARRAPGGTYSTKRREADAVEFLSGLVEIASAPGGTDGTGLVTCGAPVAFLIRNTDARSQDYAKLKDIPRPSHADFAAYLKYHGYNDIRGGGQFSGRLTAPLCARPHCRRCGQDLWKRRGRSADAGKPEEAGSPPPWAWIHPHWAASLRRAAST